MRKYKVDIEPETMHALKGYAVFQETSNDIHTRTWWRKIAGFYGPDAGQHLRVFVHALQVEVHCTVEGVPERQDTPQRRLHWQMVSSRHWETEEALETRPDAEIVKVEGDYHLKMRTSGKWSVHPTLRAAKDAADSAWGSP